MYLVIWKFGTRTESITSKKINTTPYRIICDNLGNKLNYHNNEIKFINKSNENVLLYLTEKPVKKN